MKETILKNLKNLTVVCIIAGCVFLAFGFYKRHVYENNRYSKSENVYVEGDAYNFIINGTYFTGYSVIGMGFLIIGTMTGTKLYTLMYFSDSKDLEEQSDGSESIEENQE